MEAENKNKAEENSVILMDLEKQAITSKDRWVRVIRVYKFMINAWSSLLVNLQINLTFIWYPGKYL